MPHARVSQLLTQEIVPPIGPARESRSGGRKRVRFLGVCRRAAVLAQKIVPAATIPRAKVCGKWGREVQVRMKTSWVWNMKGSWTYCGSESGTVTSMIGGAVVVNVHEVLLLDLIHKD